MKNAALLSLLLAFFMHTSMADSPKAVKVSDGEAHAGLGYFGTSPESPDGKRIAYTRFPVTPRDDTASWAADIWLCNHDLTGHRKIAKVGKAGNHNAAYILWLDDQRLAYQDNIRGQSAYILDVVTGKVLHGPLGANIAMGHESIDGKFLIAENAPGSPLGARGVYLVDAREKTTCVLKTTDLEFLAPRMGGSDDPGVWRIQHPQQSPDGSKISIKLTTENGEDLGITVRADGSDIILFGPKPMHPTWFDNETLCGHDNQVGDGQPNSHENRQWTRDGKFLRTLSGPGNHLARSPDGAWFASESWYGSKPVVLSLYRAGETQPVAELMRHQFASAVWERHAHVNPAFSRDGRRVYFNQAVDENKTQVFYRDISPLVAKPGTGGSNERVSDP